MRVEANAVFRNQLGIAVGQMTTPHWHPNASETLIARQGICEVYVLDSALVSDVVSNAPDLSERRFRLLATLNEAHTDNGGTEEAPDVNTTAIPRGRLHYVINTGRVDVILDTVFDTFAPDVIFLSQGVDGAINTTNPSNALDVTYASNLTDETILQMSGPGKLAQPFECQ